MSQKEYIAIGSLASGKHFRYSDKSKDMQHFVNYVLAIYPDFDIDVVIEI